MTELVHYTLKKYNKYFQNVPLSTIPILRKEDISTKYSHFRVSGDGKKEDKCKPVPTARDIRQNTQSTYKKSNCDPYDDRQPTVKNIHKKNDPKYGKCAPQNSKIDDTYKRKWYKMQR